MPDIHRITFPLFPWIQSTLDITAKGPIGEVIVVDADHREAGHSFSQLHCYRFLPNLLALN